MRVSNLWSSLDFRRQQTILSGFSDLHYKAAVLLTNINTIMRRGNIISDFFHVQPPELEEYLQLVMLDPDAYSSFRD